MKHDKASMCPEYVYSLSCPTTGDRIGRAYATCLGIQLSINKSGTMVRFELAAMIGTLLPRTCAANAQLGGKYRVCIRSLIVLLCKF